VETNLIAADHFIGGYPAWIFYRSVIADPEIGRGATRGIIGVERGYPDLRQAVVSGRCGVVRVEELGAAVAIEGGAVEGNIFGQALIDGDGAAIALFPRAVPGVAIGIELVSGSGCGVERTCKIGVGREGGPVQRGGTERRSRANGSHREVRTGTEWNRET